MAPAAATAAARADQADRRAQRRAGAERTRTAPRSADTRPRARRLSGPAAPALARDLLATPDVDRPHRPRPVERPARRPAERPVRRPTERPARRPRPARDQRPPAARPQAARRARLQLRLDPRWLDRIVRGRVWIPLLAVSLVGIVGMRVEVLKLGSSVGRSTELASQLSAADQLLLQRVSGLSSEQRIMRLAAAYGMVMPGPMDDHFVRAGGRGLLTRAIGSISDPDASAFLAGLQTERAADSEAVNASSDTSAIGQSDGGSTGAMDAGTTTGTTDEIGVTGDQGTTGGSPGTADGQDGSTSTPPSQQGSNNGGVSIGG